ncbi:MAG: sulfite exporter TauE/SafE family protein [Actinobacteria bacterium]|nr:sulfite exporter TauE/SafE family protein [Actinomycetota bacterium]
MTLFLYLLFTGIFAGLIGSVIGIGGGIIIVPVLTLVLKIPIHLAIGTSIISVMVTSLAAVIRFFKKDIINIPLGLALEIPTTAGGVIGSLTVAYLKNSTLFIIFGCFALASGVLTFVKSRMVPQSGNESYETLNNNNNRVNPGSAPNYLKPDSRGSAGSASSMFDSQYYDEASRQNIRYRVKRTALGGSLSLFAGILSGLLGVGGGIVKVPVMNILMNIPVKVAAATSTYMIGITAVVSAVIYFFNGFISPLITVPVVAGVLAGATGGSYLAVKLKSRYISAIILSVFTLIGIFMFLRAFNIFAY